MSAPRILVVEDEYLIRMLVEDMLGDLGYEVAAVAGTLDEAKQQAQSAQIDLAMLDVNLDGHEVFPVADILTARGKPFIFVTGYGGQGLADPYRGKPTLQKPFQMDDLKAALAAILPA